MLQYCLQLCAQYFIHPSPTGEGQIKRYQVISLHHSGIQNFFLRDSRRIFMAEYGTFMAIRNFPKYRKLMENAFYQGFFCLLLEPANFASKLPTQLHLLVNLQPAI
uniref:Uncharacterized protein n=1 Tax=Octopus bimaculoides TaxID=37653 RepID=A0A0L8GQL6_OCTBM